LQTLIYKLRYLNLAVYYLKLKKNLKRGQLKHTRKLRRSDRYIFIQINLINYL